MHVVALLPRNLLDHLRYVLGDAHSLAHAADPAELTSLLRNTSADLLIVDPVFRDGRHANAIEQIIAQHHTVPVVVYTSLQPSAIRLTLELGKLGVRHVVLNRFDDEPKRFLDLIERVPAHPMAELMLEEMAGQMRALPVVVARAIDQLFRSPAKVKNSQELAKLAGMAPRTLYRHLLPLGLLPRQLIICARLLRAFPMLRAPGSRLKEISVRLGYADPDTLSGLIVEWTGLVPKELKRNVAPEVFVRMLATHLMRTQRTDEEQADEE